jgi:hypothetical protein
MSIAPGDFAARRWSDWEVLRSRLILIHPALKGAALGLTCLAITTPCIIAVVVWEKTHPPAFNITVVGDTVDFEFLDPDYAREFAALNRASISIAAQPQSMT